MGAKFHGGTVQRQTSKTRSLFLSPNNDNNYECNEWASSCECVWAEIALTASLFKWTPVIASYWLSLLIDDMDDMLALDGAANDGVDDDGVDDDDDGTAPLMDGMTPLLLRLRVCCDDNNNDAVATNNWDDGNDAGAYGNDNDCGTVAQESMDDCDNDGNESHRVCGCDIGAADDATLLRTIWVAEKDGNDNNSDELRRCDGDNGNGVDASTTVVGALSLRCNNLGDNKDNEATRGRMLGGVSGTLVHGWKGISWVNWDDTDNEAAAVRFWSSECVFFRLYDFLGARGRDLDLGLARAVGS